MATDKSKKSDKPAQSDTSTSSAGRGDPKAGGSLNRPGASTRKERRQGRSKPDQQGQSREAATAPSPGRQSSPRGAGRSDTQGSGGRASRGGKPTNARPTSRGSKALGAGRSGGGAGKRVSEDTARSTTSGSPGSGSKSGKKDSGDRVAPPSTGGSAGGKTGPRSSRGRSETAGGKRTAGAGGVAGTTSLVPDSPDGTPGTKAGSPPVGSGSAGRASGLAQGAKNGAGSAAGKAIEGKGSSRTRRYAGQAVAGGVNGGLQGGLHGAAVGAAKETGIEAGKDTVKGAGKTTGGSPVAEPADKRLGAGGTGYERQGKKGEASRGSKVAKGVAVGGTAAAAPPAMAIIMLMSLLHWLKSMFFASLAMAANMANALWGFIVNTAKAAAHAVAAPFMAIGGFVANTAGAVLGVAVTATVAPVAAAFSGMVATVAAVAMLGTVFAGVLNSPTLTAGDIGSSNDGRCVATVGAGGAGAQVPANTVANAKTVYSVLSSWGMPDENIAGILGNWSQESGIDPTSVEGIFSEPYRIGPRKQEAWDNNFTHIPGQSHGGIGLGQWSNGRTMLLLDYAAGKGVEWYTIQTQLAFMVQGDNPHDVAVFKDMIRNSQGSPGAAAMHFHENWERSADNAQGQAERRADAKMWFGKMSGWEVDDSIIGGVEDIVGDLIEVIGGGGRALSAGCDDGGGGAVSPQDGGMTNAEAQAFMDFYNKNGDNFLDARYGNIGGPGSCGNNHAMNCVSFSTYFVNKYTTFQGYPPGNGIETAYSIAEMSGQQMSNVPTPYSVGSGPGVSSAGHTLVVLGVQGEQVIVGEAGYCAYMGRVRVTTVSALQADGWMFVDMSDEMLPEDKIKKV